MSDRAYEKYLGDTLGLSNDKEDLDGGEPSKVKTKKLYSLLKKDSTGIAPLRKDDQTLLTETGKANALKDQFQAVFSPKTPIRLKSLAQKSLQGLHDSGSNPTIQAQSPPQNAWYK